MVDTVKLKEALHALVADMVDEGHELAAIAEALVASAADVAVEVTSAPADAAPPVNEQPVPADEQVEEAPPAV